MTEKFKKALQELLAIGWLVAVAVAITYHEMSQKLWRSRWEQQEQLREREFRIALLEIQVQSLREQREQNEDLTRFYEKLLEENRHWVQMYPEHSAQMAKRSAEQCRKNPPEKIPVGGDFGGQGQRVSPGGGGESGQH